MWTMAEKTIRADPHKGKTMERYDQILEEELGDELKPIGTDERQKQAHDFFNMEIEQLDAIDTTRALETQLLDPHTP